MLIQDVVIFQIRRLLVLGHLDQSEAVFDKFFIRHIKAYLKAFCRFGKSFSALYHKSEWYTMRAGDVFCEVAHLNKFFVLMKCKFTRLYLFSKKLYSFWYTVERIKQMHFTLLLAQSR